MPDSPLKVDPSKTLQRSKTRTLRVEVNGLLHDWFDVDELDDVVRSSTFQGTLKENIARYFGVPVKAQVLFDDEGLLATHADIGRALQRKYPKLYIYDISDMGPQMLAKTSKRLEALDAEADEVRRHFKLLQKVEASTQSAEAGVQSLSQKPSEILKPPSPAGSKDTERGKVPDSPQSVATVRAVDTASNAAFVPRASPAGSAPSLDRAAPGPSNQAATSKATGPGRQGTQAATATRQVLGQSTQRVMGSEMPEAGKITIQQPTVQTASQARPVPAPASVSLSRTAPRPKAAAASSFARGTAPALIQQVTNGLQVLQNTIRAVSPRGPVVLSPRDPQLLLQPGQPRPRSQSPRPLQGYPQGFPLPTAPGQLSPQAQGLLSPVSPMTAFVQRLAPAATGSPLMSPRVVQGAAVPGAQPSAAPRFWQRLLGAGGGAAAAPANQPATPGPQVRQVLQMPAQAVQRTQGVSLSPRIVAAAPRPFQTTSAIPAPGYHYSPQAAAPQTQVLYSPYSPQRAGRADPNVPRALSPLPAQAVRMTSPLPMFRREETWGHPQAPPALQAKPYMYGGDYRSMFPRERSL